MLLAREQGPKGLFIIGGWKNWVAGMRVYEEKKKKVDTGVEIKKRHQGVNFLLKIVLHV